MLERLDILHAFKPFVKVINEMCGLTMTLNTDICHTSLFMFYSFIHSFISFNFIFI